MASLGSYGASVSAAEAAMASLGSHNVDRIDAINQLASTRAKLAQVKRVTHKICPIKSTLIKAINDGFKKPSPLGRLEDHFFKAVFIKNFVGLKCGSLSKFGTPINFNGGNLEVIDASVADKLVRHLDVGQLERLTSYIQRNLVSASRTISAEFIFALFSRYNKLSIRRLKRVISRIKLRLNVFFVSRVSRLKGGAFKYRMRLLGRSSFNSICGFCSVEKEDFRNGKTLFNHASGTINETDIFRPDIRETSRFIRPISRRSVTSRAYNSAARQSANGASEGFSGRKHKRLSSCGQHIGHQRVRKALPYFA